MVRSILLALLVVAGACHRSELVAGVSDSAYVRAMSGLRYLPTSPIDPQARERSRDSILSANGMTAAQFEAATLALAKDPIRASEIFRAVENRPAVAVPMRTNPARENKDGATK